jgi:hypothetical protein
MYLATIYVTLDLEPEVTTSHRERLLRSIRDRLRQNFGQRITIRTDDEASITIAFFDESHGRVKARAEEMIERLESFGEARILSSTIQVFQWFDGKYQETRESMSENEEESDDSESFSGRLRAPVGGGRSRGRDSTIRYDDEDGEAEPIPSRFGRRPIRPSER